MSQITNLGGMREPSRQMDLRGDLNPAGRVSVLADNFCFARDAGGDPVASAAVATAFAAPYGHRVHGARSSDP